MRYLRLFEAFNLSGKCPLWDASSQGNVCRAFVWSGKCPSGICLVEEMSVGQFAWWRKCSSGMCLVGEMSVREVSVGEGPFGEMSVGDVSGNHLIIYTSLIRRMPRGLSFFKRNALRFSVLKAGVVSPFFKLA